MSASLAFGTVLVVLVGLVSLGCATVRSGPPTVALRITTSAPDATIWIDDHLAGRASDFSKGEKRLPAGFHRIEVRAPGYYSAFQEVDGKPGTPITLDVPLHQLLE